MSFWWSHFFNVQPTPRNLGVMSLDFKASAILWWKQRQWDLELLKIKNSSKLWEFDGWLCILEWKVYLEQLFELILLIECWIFFQKYSMLTSMSICDTHFHKSQYSRYPPWFIFHQQLRNRNWFCKAEASNSVNDPIITPIFCLIVGNCILNKNFSFSHKLGFLIFKLHQTLITMPVSLEHTHSFPCDWLWGMVTVMGACLSKQNRWILSRVFMYFSWEFGNGHVCESDCSCLQLLQVWMEKYLQNNFLG